ncbi:hypothetical protein FJ651_04420 [Paucihalobacter ruber]|uniref:Uncharacterized protein n=1 Tax=Paucihalobacter ruber TaxID=2567861 RepID=A0A506PLN8_9FLAO|nr:hypothetical protein [Paucihalobacter ruber]TPV34783.1 hypothetical protein FJ651_04420 [Paucihalobacter ruber]
MKSKLLYIIVISLIVFTCEKKTDNTESQAPKNVADLTSSDIKNLKYTDYILGNDGSKLFINWKKFQELNIQMGYLKQGDLSFFKNEKAEVKALFDSLKTTVPDTINTKPIVSRFAVLETKSLKLQDNLNMDNIEKATKLTSVKEVLVAFGNLNLQINKKLEFDANEYFKPVD